MPLIEIQDIEGADEIAQRAGSCDRWVPSDTGRQRTKAERYAGPQPNGREWVRAKLPPAFCTRTNRRVNNERK